MAGELGLEMKGEGGTKNYYGKITPFVVFSCMVAAMGGVIFGYDIGISGGLTSMEPFLEKFFPEVYTKMREDTTISNYCKFDSQLLTSFTSSLYVAGFVASFFASPVTRVFGRKPSILIGGAAFLAGAAVNIYMLIMGRILLGIGVGFANQHINRNANAAADHLAKIILSDPAGLMGRLSPPNCIFSILASDMLTDFVPG